MLNNLRRFKKEVFFEYLIYLFPFFFLLGPAVINSVKMIISFYGFFIIFFVKRDIDLKNKKIYLILIFLFFYLFINSLLHNNLNYLGNTLLPLYLIFFTEVILYLLEKNRFDINKLIIFFSVILSIVVLDTYLQYFTGKNILGYGVEPNNHIRLSSFFKNKWVVGTYFSKLFFPIFIILFLFEKSKKYFIFLSFLFFLYALIIFLSGERTSFFIFLLNLFASIILIKKFRKIFLIFFIIFSLIISSFILFNKKMNNRYVNETFHTTLSLDNNFKKNIFNNQYGAIFLASNIIWQENFYFGGGMHSYRIKTCGQEFKDLSKSVSVYSNHYMFICSTHPHNYILELLVDSGIIGLIFFLSFLFYVFFILTRISGYNFISTAFGIGFLSQFFPFMTHGSIFSSWNNNFIIFNFALFYSYYFFKKKIL
jgi:O-antigen ligase